MKIRVMGLSVAGTVLLVAAGLALFAFDFPRVRGNEMAPGLRDGDLLLACRVCGTPRPGDVVLFAPAGDGEEKLSLRRVVAVPGDRVEMRKGQLLVNGQPLSDEKRDEVQLAGIDAVDSAARPFDLLDESLGRHRYQVLRDSHAPATGELAAQTLLKQYFVLADRRSFARDSRHYGPVPQKSIRSIVRRVLSAGDKDVQRQRALP